MKNKNISFDDVDFSKYSKEIKKINKAYNKLKTNKKFMKKVELINLTSTNISRFFDVIDYNCNITKSDDNGFKNNAISVKKMFDFKKGASNNYSPYQNYSVIGA